MENKKEKPHHWVGEKNPINNPKNKDKLIDRNKKESNPIKTEDVKNKNKKRMIEYNLSEQNPMKQEENKIKLSERVSGKGNPNFKYTEEMTNKIIELRKSGLSQLEIAKQTGFSKTKVGEICKKNNI